MLILPKVDVIKRKRQEMNLSMSALSLKAGLPSQSIYRIESGKTTKINSFRAKEIAQALGCEVTDIFTAEKPNDLENAAEDAEKTEESMDNSRTELILRGNEMALSEFAIDTKELAIYAWRHGRRLRG